MTTDFKASQVQTSKVIVTGSFAGGSANQLLVYSIDADDSGTPNQGVIDTAVFDTASGIGSDVFLFVSGSTSSRGVVGSYGASVIGGDLHVSGNLTVGGTSPGGGGGGNDYWKSTTAGQIFATGTLAAITGTLRASFLSSSNGLSVTGTFTHGTSTSAIGTNSHAQGDSSTANGNASHAEGIGTNSYGVGSHAEGNTTTAGGNYSHSEGENTNSSAPYSHAEGYNTYLGTGADWAHVEGYESTAYGRASHAEGYQTTAGNNPNGEYSHSEGYQTNALNKYAHSEGDGTAALGSGSHTEGLATRAGLWGWPIVSIDTSAQVPYAIFGVSSGLFALDLSGEFGGADVITDAGATYSIINFNWPGGTTTYVTASSVYGFAGPYGSYGAYLGTSIAGVTNQTTFGAVQIAGKNSHTEGSGSISIGEYSHAEGESSVSFSTGSHAEGYYSISRGNYSHSEGAGTQAGGVYSHAEGSYTKAYGGAAHSEGDSTRAGRQGYYISNVDIVSQPGYGIYEIETNYEDVSSQFGSADILIEHIDGNIKKYGYVSSSYDSIAINTYVTASDIFGVGSFYGTDGVKFGIITDISAIQLVRADSSIGGASHAEGANTVSYGYASHAEGVDTIAYGFASHAEGVLTIAADYGSHAEGYLTTGSGQYSHAEGSGSIAFASASHAGGIFTIASGSGQTVFGKYNKRNNSDSLFVIGSGDGDLDANRNDILLVNSQSVMIGSGTLGSDVFLYVTGVAGSKDTAIAGTAVFAGDVAISGTLYGGSPLKIGSSLLITGAVSQGSNAQAVGAYSRAGGSNTIAFAGWSVAEGSNSVAAGLYSHANGSDARSGKRAFELQSIGAASVDVASQAPYAIYKVKNTYTDVTLEFSPYATIIVFDTASNGGYYDYVDSNYDGTNTYITASDAYGIGTFFSTSADKISNGSYVNQPSADQNAGGDSSHAEGYRAVAVGVGSHAEGEQTIAVGAYSHTEGVGTVSLGNNSHAEGDSTFSSGDNSHAEGYATIASGTHSHAEGFLSFAKGDYSHTEGRGTQAIGDGSHAEGYATWAIGPWSHAGGLGTFASGAYQTVVGKYNVSQNDTSLFVIGDGIFVIGDGPNSSNRSDIVRVNSGTLPGSGSFEVTGTVRSTLGFSGSLTQLTDGTPYLIAGTGIQTSTGSNGAVTISTTGGGGFSLNAPMSSSMTNTIPGIYEEVGAFYVPTSTTPTTIQAFVTSETVVNTVVRITDSAGNTMFPGGDSTMWDGSNQTGFRTISASPIPTFSSGWYRVQIKNFGGNGNIATILGLVIS